MDQPLTIGHNETASHGRYFIRLAEDAEAEMTYRRTADHVITIDHTYTPPAYRGHNVAQRLMDRVIADVRAEGTRIVPLCSYVAAQFRRHPEWADLLAD